MATSIVYVSLLLVALWLAEGHTTAPDNSHCSYTFNVPWSACCRTANDDNVLKELVFAQQAQLKLLAVNQERMTLDVRQLIEQNANLQEELISLKAVGEGSTRSTAVALKQCSKRELSDGRETGPVFSCDFIKKRDDTVLRVVWNGGMRLIDSGPKSGSCRRWFFTINGQECRKPSTIDAQLHIRDAETDISRPAYVEGYCRNIPAGDVNVVWNVGNCLYQGSYNVGDSLTGWKATVRIIVQEVYVEDADKVIV